MTPSSLPVVEAPPGTAGEWRGSATQPPRPADYWVLLGVYAALTIVVWGAFAFSRGLWGDDTLTLMVVHGREGWARFLAPIVSPTRLLLGAPYSFALLWTAPALVLQAIYGLTWLAGGLASYSLLRALFPGGRWVAFVGGSLTLCATGDFLMNSLVSLGYEMSAALFVGAAACLLRWSHGARLPSLMAAGVLLSMSVWTSDVAVAVAPLVPVLLWAEGGFRVHRRLAAAALLWYGLLVPYGMVLLRSLSDPGSYVAGAIVRMPWPARVERILSLYLHNFDAVAWGPARENLFTRGLPSVIPSSLWFGLAGVATLCFLGGAWWFRESALRANSDPPASGWRVLVVVAVLLALAFVSNASYAFVKWSETFFRTQILSRYWTSMAIALAAYGVTWLPGRSWAAAAVLPGFFVALGSYGGLDRQDFYLAYWQRHERELRSIVENAPRLRESARLILRVPQEHHYMATEAEYLARSWTMLLYDDPSLDYRTYLWSPSRGTSCELVEDAFLCNREGRTEQEVVLFKEAISMSYDLRANRFFLDEVLPRGDGPDKPTRSDDYQPRAQIVGGPPTSLARRLLYRP